MSVEMLRNQLFALFVLEQSEMITGRVLDVGCGRKPFKNLCENASEWVGLDPRPAIGDVLAFAEEMPFEDGSFDTVLCIDVLSYCLRPFDALAECARVLTPGGKLILAAQTNAPDDSIWYGFHTSGLIRMCRNVGLEDGGHISSAGNIFSRGEGETYWSNETWIDGVGETDFSRFCEYLDVRYPSIACIVAVKPQEGDQDAET